MKEMHYLYIDTICSHPTAGKAKRRQPKQNLSDNYPTINNKAGNDIYNFVEQSPGMELVDMTNIIEMRKENQDDFQQKFKIKLGHVRLFHSIYFE